MPPCKKYSTPLENLSVSCSDVTRQNRHDTAHERWGGKKSPQKICPSVQKSRVSLIACFPARFSFIFISELWLDRSTSTIPLDFWLYVWGCCPAGRQIVNQSKVLQIISQVFLQICPVFSAPYHLFCRLGIVWPITSCPVNSFFPPWLWISSPFQIKVGDISSFNSTMLQTSPLVFTKLCVYYRGSQTSQTVALHE